MRLAILVLAWVPLGAAADRPFTVGERLATDDFTHGIANWTAELERGGAVTAKDGVLDIDVPAGLSLWWKREFTGPVLIRYEATMVQAGGPND
ncbi:MAG TPA: DUF6250 domain-containing protein, partial [Bryobacteraceae bacterium]